MSGERLEAARVWGLRIGIGLAVLPVLYVLSVGPAARWHNNRRSNGTLTDEQHENMQRFYKPLDIFYVNAPESVAAALDWYEYLWD